MRGNGNLYPYELTVTDDDGEVQTYRYFQRDMGAALRCVPDVLARYGHNGHTQICVSVARLVADAPMHNAVTFAPRGDA